MKKLFLSLLLISNIGFAKNWTTEKTFAVDFSHTDINPNDVKVTYEYWCNYKFKFLDIIEGRMSEGTKSCGEKKYDLKIVDGKITLPAIIQFDHRKADTLSRYGMQIKFDWNGRNLLWVSTGADFIPGFFAAKYDLRFEKFQMTDLEVTFNGINLIESPEFNGEKTQVTTYFSVKHNETAHYFIDTDLTRSFKWYLTPYSHINRNDRSKLGKISLAPTYHAFLNDESVEVYLDVYAKDKADQFVTAEHILIPLTQEAIDQIKSVEIKRK